MEYVITAEKNDWGWGVDMRAWYWLFVMIDR
jgi:hypothetical protein